MRFSLPSAVILFCATTALAFPQPSSNDIAARDAEVEITDVVIDYDSADYAELVARGTKGCSNDGLIKRVKKEYGGKCNPINSRGWKSAHNCKTAGGGSYLCVQSKKATCYVSLISR